MSIPITCTLHIAQVSHSTSQDHIATAFHFFRVNRGPVGVFPLAFFTLGGSSKDCPSAMPGVLLPLSMSGDLCRF